MDRVLIPSARQRTHPSHGHHGPPVTDEHGVGQQGVLSAISNEMVRIYGRGPTKTRTRWAGTDIIVVTLEDTFTPAERSLKRMGEHERLRDLRLLFQYAETERFCEPVERLTGRKVRAFISGIDTVSDIATEMFMMHPPGYEGTLADRGQRRLTRVAGRLPGDRG